jgi:hypothetical protein
MRPVSRGALRCYAGQRRLGTGEGLWVRGPAGRYALRLVARDRARRISTARRLVRVDAPALTLTRVAYDRQVAAGARRLTVTIATSIPATVTAAGRAYAVGPRAKRLRIALPARPAHGRVGVPVSIRGGGQRRSGRLVVVRR